MSEMNPLLFRKTFTKIPPSLWLMSPNHPPRWLVLPGLNLKEMCRSRQKLTIAF